MTERMANCRRGVVAIFWQDVGVLSEREAWNMCLDMLNAV